MPVGRPRLFVLFCFVFSTVSFTLPLPPRHTYYKVTRVMAEGHPDDRVALWDSVKGKAICGTRAPKRRLLRDYVMVSVDRFVRLFCYVFSVMHLLFFVPVCLFGGIYFDYEFYSS